MRDIDRLNEVADCLIAARRELQNAENVTVYTKDRRRYERGWRDLMVKLDGAHMAVKALISYTPPPPRAQTRESELSNTGDVE